MIYTFLSDEALWKKEAGINPELDANQGVCYPTAFMLDYFKNMQVVSDVRPSRLTILSDKATGDMRLYTDADRYPNGVDPFSGVQETEYNKLFNVIEQVMFQVGTVAEIDTTLSGSANDFGGYQTGSLDVATTSVNAEVTGISGTISNTPVKNWMSFEFELNGVVTPLKYSWVKMHLRQIILFVQLLKLFFQLNHLRFYT